MTRGIALVLLSALIPSLAAGAAEPQGLDVPLTIWDVAGVERKQDVCSSGIPIPCGLLKEPEGVAVFDPSGKAVPAQFRVLERWREKADGKDDGSVKWLLVTFFADVPAGKSAVYRLKSGQNPAPDRPVKVADKGNAWDLGGALVKKDFSSPFRLLLTNPDGKEIGPEGQAITWSVWEQGPLRACLRAESPTDHDKFGFIAWVYAYAPSTASGSAGQAVARWDMKVVLKNTPNDMKGPFSFRDFSVAWAPAEIDGAAEYVLGGEWGKPVAGVLEGSTPVYLHQDSDGTEQWNTFGKDYQMSPVLDWTPNKIKAKAGLPAFRGYKVMAGAKELGSGNFAAGWAALSTGKAGAFAAVRDYYPQYPKATEVAKGKIVLRLWPKYTTAFDGLHWLDDVTRKWHDLSFRLMPAPVDAARAEAMSKAFDYPLVAAAPAEWCYQTGAVGRSPENAQRKPFGGQIVKSQPGTGRNWVNFGGDVTDQIRRRYHGADLGGFISTGDPTAAYFLYKTAGHSSGMTPLWLDDYQYPRDVKKLTHEQYCGLARDPGKYRTNTWHHGFMTWNDAHFCAQEVFDNWRVFGDPLALDALTTIGRWCQAYVDMREAKPGNLIAGTRADGLPFHNLGEAYRILGDESMKKSMDRLAEVSWKQVNKERGNYGVMGSWEGGNDKCEKPFMMAQVMKGLRAHYDLTGSERTADQIYGMADFIIEESGIGEWGYKYVVLIEPASNKVNQAASLEAAAKAGKNLSYGDLAWVMAWVYNHFGDERFRRNIDGLNTKAYPYVPRQYTGYYPEREDKEPPPAVKDLAARPLGGGQVELTWSAPAGDPVRYQVKWADKPMVERLAYPDEKDVKANWWAANHIENEPKPGAPGTGEKMTVDGVPPGKHFFAIRAFDAASNRSGLGNVVEVDAP